MSAKTTPGPRQAASVFRANDDYSDDDGFTVGSDLDDFIPESSHETPTLVSTVVEGTKQEEGMNLARDDRDLRLNYDNPYHARRCRDLDSAKEELDDSVNVDLIAYEKDWALADSIRKRHIDNIALLLERGADANFQIIGLPLIFHAVKQKEHAPQIIQLLLDHGADLEATSGPTDATGNDDINALHWAAGKGMIHAADFLISKGVDISKPCSSGKTPLILAAERGHLEVVKLLLAKGAGLHERYANGGSALMWAASQGHERRLSTWRLGIRHDNNNNCGVKERSIRVRSLGLGTLHQVDSALRSNHSLFISRAPRDAGPQHVYT